MTIGLVDPSAELDPDSRRIRASFTIRNSSGIPWTPDSLQLGWQLYDPETGMFIMEGEWSSIPRIIAPKEQVEHQVDLHLPPEKGRYHLYISPRTGAGWFYSEGKPFVLVEAVVEHGRARLIDVRATTLRALHWRRLLKSYRTLLFQPFYLIRENWSLARSMVRRDISARYRGSFGDVLWTVLNPLLLVLTYFFVFGVVLEARFGGDPSRAGFALYFVAGMLPWLPFSEAVGRAPTVVLEHRNFVKKLVFPIEIVPVNLTLAGLVTQAFALAVFLLFVLVSRGELHLTALWLPVLIVPQLLLTLGLAWLLAALGVFLRDLGQVIGYLLTLWFFLTPICYPEENLPDQVARLLALNPVYVLVRGFRACLLEGSAPAWSPLWKLWLLSFAAFLFGHAVFRRLRRAFADTL